MEPHSESRQSRHVSPARLGSVINNELTPEQRWAAEFLGRLWDLPGVVFQECKTKTSGGLSRAFSRYVDVKEEQRAILLAEFPKAGPRAIGLFIEQLRDKREPVRRAAHELLGKMLDKRFLFGPTADAEMHAMMLGPIDTWWAHDGLTIAWNAESGKFVERLRRYQCRPLQFAARVARGAIETWARNRSNPRSSAIARSLRPK